MQVAQFIGGAALREPGRQFVGNRRICGLQRDCFRLHGRSHQIGGEAVGKQIAGYQSHAHNEQHRNDADKNASDQQTVAQPPQKHLAHPAQSEDGEQDQVGDGKRAQPAVESVSSSATADADHDLLDPCQQQLQSQKEQRKPRQTGARR